MPLIFNRRDRSVGWSMAWAELKANPTSWELAEQGLGPWILSEPQILTPNLPWLYHTFYGFRGTVENAKQEVGLKVDLTDQYRVDPDGAFEVDGKRVTPVNWREVPLHAGEKDGADVYLPAGIPLYPPMRLLGTPHWIRFGVWYSTRQATVASGFFGTKTVEATTDVSITCYAMAWEGAPEIPGGAKVG